jgi:hypothetical protein
MIVGLLFPLLRVIQTYCWAERRVSLMPAGDLLADDRCSTISSLLHE